MNVSAEIVFQVPFHDVDMMGVVWHGHYYKYFELARTELFRRLNFDLEQIAKTGYLLPVIVSDCRYVAPLTYGMQVRVLATLVETEFRLKVNYQLSEAATGRRLARGNTIQVVVHREEKRLLAPVPADIANLIAKSLCG